MRTLFYWAKALWVDLLCGTALTAAAIFEPAPAYGTRCLAVILIFWRVCDGIDLAIQRWRLQNEIVELKKVIAERMGSCDKVKIT